MIASLRLFLRSVLFRYKERLEQIQKINGALDLLSSGTFPPEIQTHIAGATGEIQTLCSSLGGNTDRSLFLEEMQSHLTKRTTRQTALEAEVNGLHGALEAVCELLVEKQLSLNSCYDSLRSLRGAFSSSSTSPGASTGGNEPSGPSQDGSSSPSSSSSSQSTPRRSNKLEEEIRARMNFSADAVGIPDIVSVDVAADPDMLMSAFDDVKRQCLDVLGAAGNRGGREASEENTAELHEQIARLKAHLGRKRDEANLLKEALNNTQITAEKALANLKAKYECEKEGSSRNLLQLRRELNQRKEYVKMPPNDSSIFTQ